MDVNATIFKAYDIRGVVGTTLTEALLGLDEPQSIAALMRAVMQQAYTIASLDYFYASTLIAVALAVLVWIARRPRIASGLPAAAAD